MKQKYKTKSEAHNLIMKVTKVIIKVRIPFFHSNNL